MAAWALADDDGEDDFLSRLEQKINGIQNMAVTESPPTTTEAEINAAVIDKSSENDVKSNLSPMSMTPSRRISLGTLLDDDLGLSNIEGFPQTPSPRRKSESPSHKTTCLLRVPRVQKEESTQKEIVKDNNKSSIVKHSVNNVAPGESKGLTVSELRTSLATEEKKYDRRLDDCFDRTSIHHPKHVKHILMGKLIREENSPKKPWQNVFNASGTKKRFLHKSVVDDEQDLKSKLLTETFDNDICVTASPFKAKRLDNYTVSTPAPRLPSAKPELRKQIVKQKEDRMATENSVCLDKSKTKVVKDFISLNKSIKPKKTKNNVHKSTKRRLSWKERNLKNADLPNVLLQAKHTKAKLSDTLDSGTINIYVKSPWHGKPARSLTSRAQFLSGSTGGSIYTSSRR